MVILCACNGVIAMTTYMAYIFQETGSNLSPNTSAITVGAIQVFGMCAADGRSLRTEGLDFINHRNVIIFDNFSF